MPVNIRLNSHQLDLLSKYFADLSKILVASTVIAYFIPIGNGVVTIPVFIVGAFVAASLLALSVQLTK